MPPDAWHCRWGPCVVVCACYLYRSLWQHCTVERHCAIHTHTHTVAVHTHTQVLAQRALTQNDSGGAVAVALA